MNHISSYRGTLRPAGDILERGVSQLRTLHIQITVPRPATNKVAPPVLREEGAATGQQVEDRDRIQSIIGWNRRKTKV